jgi:predicted CXXCH cytochrome family protein
MRRSQRASAPRIGLGRGTDNQVPLADIRVGLHLAALVPRDDGMAIEKLGTSPMIVNGQSVEVAVLSPGDEIVLGPYRLEVLETPEGCDGAIQIELTQPMGVALERLSSTARMGLDRTRVNKRIYAWSGFVVIAVVCLAVPVIFFGGGIVQSWQKDSTQPMLSKLVGLSWNTGDFSNAHRFFGANCATCHQGPFSRVTDAACMACHASVGSHFEHGISLGGVGDRLAGLRCIACHTEHRGMEGSIVRTEGLCLNCHRDINETTPSAGTKDVTGFPSGHPQFRATLVADASLGTTVRAQLGATPPPIDHPGIKFAHADHLVKGGFPALNYKELTCADCHVADPSGRSFLPITYRNQCERCHELTFDKTAGIPWKVPHGDDTGVITAVWNYFAGLGLAGQAGEPANTPEPAVERRGAGMPAPVAALPATAPPGDKVGWVTEKSMAALRLVFDDKRGCAYCHYGTGKDGAFDTDNILASALPPKENPAHFVAAVSMRTRFLPAARFDHAQHRGMSCADCHAAQQNASAAEVLIPGIDTCTKCHGTETASLHAQSTCISCHIFHRSEFGPMRSATEARQ